MTYYEAQKQIDDNWRLLDRYTLFSNPPHMIKGCFVAPIKRDLNQERYIFIKCIEESVFSNEKIIFDLNLESVDLTPFVAIQIWGNIIFIPLDSYLSAPWKTNDEGNDL